jgi:hypothetical protein
MSDWTHQQEQLLVTWAEKASGSAWLHSKSISHYRHMSYWLAVPACVFGYAAGMMSFGTTDSDANSVRFAIGVMGMLSGVFVSLQEIFPFKELSAQHRMASLRFLSFFRDVSCELSVHANHRVEAAEYISMKRVELDKLHEQTPSIPDRIIQLFEARFQDVDIHRPDATGTLQTIVPYGQARHLTGARLVEVANSESSSLSSQDDPNEYDEHISVFVETDL